MSRWLAPVLATVLLACGGPAGPASPASPAATSETCAVSPVRSATAVGDLREVVELLVHTSESRDGEPVVAESEEDAAALLCRAEPCDVHAPFVSDFVESVSVLGAHVVVPREGGGYWVIPHVGPTANGMAARCPDVLRGASASPLERAGTRYARLRVTWLENRFVECEADAPDCLEGCVFGAREDEEILVEPTTGRFVIASARGSLTSDAGAEEGESLLPEPAFSVGVRGLELACAPLEIRLP